VPEPEPLAGGPAADEAGQEAGGEGVAGPTTSTVNAGTNVSSAPS
jgi:hypothetical protein